MAVEFVLRIELTTYAMRLRRDVASVLEQVGRSIQATPGVMAGDIRDRHGNIVGTWSFERKER